MRLELSTDSARSVKYRATDSESLSPVALFAAI